MKHLETVINSGIFSEIQKKNYIDAFEQLVITDKKYRKGEIILLEGELMDNLCIVESGSVISEKLDLNGDVHVADLYAENEIVGLEFAASRMKNIAIDYVSNEESSLVFVSMDSIEKSDYATDFRKAFSYMLANNCIKNSHRIGILAEHSLRKRIVLFLGVLREYYHSDTVIFKMNRERLAQYLCVNRSALSNELNNMKREGLIDIKGNEVTIKEKSL